MDENDLKRYTVILDGGSGVLFQPLDETKTYILSAKHVFYNDVEHDNGPDTKELKGRISYRLSNNQETPIEIELKKGVNYYEHDHADAAILVLEENLVFDQIFVDERITGFEGFNLTGYPNSKRKTDDKYDKQMIRDLISYNDNSIVLRLVVAHLDHEQITGFSGGGIIKTNGDSLVLAGVQSETPIGNCNGEIMVIPAKKFIEIVEQNNLSQLLPNYFSKIDLLLSSILELNQTILTLKPKLQAAFRLQAKLIKCNLKDIYIRKVLHKSSKEISSLNSKQFWVSFLEYALIISILEDLDFNEELLDKIIKKKKFIFYDSSENIYDVYSDILMFAADDIDDQCQVLVGTTIPPNNKQKREECLQIEFLKISIA